MFNSISFKRLLEINNGDKMSSDEEAQLKTFHVVYIIYNKHLNKLYIGETDDTYVRLFTFWKEDKRHVSGTNAPINKKFLSDYENTYFQVIETNCDNISREYFWHNYYRNNSSYIIISHPGRHAVTSPGNKGLIAIHKENIQTYINPNDLELFIKYGWKKGGKKNRPRTAEQKRNISNAHIGQPAWNKGKKLSNEEKQKYKGIRKKRALFLTPDGDTVEMSIMSAKKYHKNWTIIKEL